MLWGLELYKVSEPAAEHLKVHRENLHGGCKTGYNSSVELWPTSLLQCSLHAVSAQQQQPVLCMKAAHLNVALAILLRQLRSVGSIAILPTGHS